MWRYPYVTMWKTLPVMCACMMDHINSYKRKKLNNQSPHQLFSFLYGADVLERLDSHLIDPNEITLKPELLK